MTSMQYQGATTRVRSLKLALDKMWNRRSELVLTRGRKSPTNAFHGASDCLCRFHANVLTPITRVLSLKLPVFGTVYFNEIRSLQERFLHHKYVQLQSQVYIVRKMKSYRHDCLFCKKLKIQWSFTHILEPPELRKHKQSPLLPSVIPTPMCT